MQTERVCDINDNILMAYFRKLITTEMQQTNVYNVQTSAHYTNVNTTLKEVEILINLYLYMGLCQLPGSYASGEKDTGCARVADL